MIVTNENVGIVLTTLQGSEGELAVDTETDGLNVRNNLNYCIGISVTTEDGFSCYFPFRHSTDNVDRKYVQNLKEIFRTRDLIWHHRKFDMHSLRTMGIDPLAFEGIQYDTMLLFHMWNEEFFSFEMDVLAKTFLKKEGKLDAETIKNMGLKFGFPNIPVSVMGPYACRDTELTFDLWRYIWPKIIKEEMDKVYLETEMPFTRILYKMEKRGVGVNLDFAKEKAFIGRNRMSTIVRELHFNPASTKDLNRILIEELGLPVLARTPKGSPSFNKKVMEEYDDILNDSDNPVAQRVGEYRGWQKAVTSLYEPLLEKVAPDGFVRTEFKQHGTVTGRLSANSPNLQQVPRNSDKKWNGNAKSAFTSGREGYTLIGWDYSQLELRFAAAYGGEGLLLQEFEKPDADPFNVLTPVIFGVLTPEFRHETKTFVYANSYGAGLPKIAAQLGRSIEETKPLFARFQDSISNILKVSNTVQDLIRQRGYVRYWDGRRRHIRNKAEAYKGWNSLCQGGGAQLVKKAMMRCEEFEDDNCFMVLQVHDEITFCIKTELIEHYRPMIEKAMTDWPDFGVRLAVDSKEWK